MMKKGIIEGDKTAFEQLVDMFSSHNYIVKSVYDMKKAKLSNEIRHTISDEAKTAIVLRELYPINDRLRNKNTISILIEKLDEYTDMVQYISMFFTSYITSANIDGSNMDIAQKEFELILDSYDLSNFEKCTPTKDFDIFIDRFGNILKYQFGKTKIVSNKYLTCNIEELMETVKTDRQKALKIFYPAYLNFLADPNKDANIQAELTSIFLMFGVEYAREYAPTLEASRWVGGVFFHYYEAEYAKFLNEQVDLYGKKIKYDLVLDEVLKVSNPKTTTSSIHWTKTKGAKIDLIRILIALYDNKYFELENGQIPTKELVMKEIGTFLNIDLNKYEQDFSHSLNNSSLETNVAIFIKLQKVIQDLKYEKDK